MANVVEDVHFLMMNNLDQKTALNFLSFYGRLATAENIETKTEAYQIEWFIKKYCAVFVNHDSFSFTRACNTLLIDCRQIYTVDSFIKKCGGSIIALTRHAVTNRIPIFE